MMESPGGRVPGGHMSSEIDKYKQQLESLTEEDVRLEGASETFQRTMSNLVVECEGLGSRRKGHEDSINVLIITYLHVDHPVRPDVGNLFKTVRKSSCSDA
jgi:hypothetical protein